MGMAVRADRRATHPAGAPAASYEGSAEQVWLLALLRDDLRSIPPGIDATALQGLSLGVTAIVLANAAISLAPRVAAGSASSRRRPGTPRWPRRTWGSSTSRTPSSAATGGTRRSAYGLFFAFLITTIIWLYDAFRPVYDLRFAE